MSHAPPLLPDRNSSKRTSSAPPEYNSNAKIKLQLNRNNTYNKYNTTKLSDDELTVTNLRKVYSSLLEEIAPHIHELGSTNNTNNSNSNWMEFHLVQRRRIRGIKVMMMLMKKVCLK